MGPIGGLKPALPPLRKLSPLGLPKTGPKSIENPLEKSVLGYLDKSKLNEAPYPQKNSMTPLGNKMSNKKNKISGNISKTKSLNLKSNIDFRKKSIETYSEDTPSESDDSPKHRTIEFRYIFNI